ncbi:WD repeat-containing protein 25 isoform X2 [Cajanus cajan]|uniref:WD repeat-containing protein 25 isoform X2 n=1 Tax=Cajanus cajan TaxID=3821 RepID=UPI00098DAF53|nr:WD repeat-containing protein 25 isoform X2 [Cajanus cajan]
MDLLCNAYSNTSDDDDDEEQPKRQRLSLSSSNPPKPRLHFSSPPLFDHQTQPPIPGRYVSKRQRALMAQTPPSPPPPQPVPVPSRFTLSGTRHFWSLSDADVPHNILSLLKSKAKGHQRPTLMSEKLYATLQGHTKAVSAIHWSSTHAHLLASAGMDHTICIWNVWSRNQKKACVLNFHNAAVKDVKWSQQGHFLLSCGYDCTSRLIDVEKGVETQVFREDQIVGVLKFHPDNSNLFLSGGTKGNIKLWDVRTGKVVHNYNRNLGPILDVEFTLTGKEFISSSDVSQSNISENAIIVWDVSRQVPLSNQVYAEAFTCPCVRRHPFDSTFVAQSNGNYVAIFTTTPPYRLNKYKRYESHAVSGFPIKCNFSLDGKKLASGSSDGSIYLYDYQSSKVVKKIKAHDEACIDVAFHPVIPNVIASCSWDGSILVVE